MCWLDVDQSFRAREDCLTPDPSRLQVAALRAQAEKKALLAAAARAVVSAAQQAQREGRLLSNQEIAAIK